MAAFNFQRAPIIDPQSCTFEEAKASLLSKHTEDYLAKLAGSADVDYGPIEKVLELITNLIHGALGQQDHTKNDSTVSVIPRGSFATRTALKGHADLDIDVVVSEKYVFPGSNGRTVKDMLGTDATGRYIVFEPEKFRDILQWLWANIRDFTAYFGQPVPHVGALTLTKGLDQLTRSLPLLFKGYVLDGMTLPEIPIDIFIKVQTKIRGQDTIVGLDKDSPLGKRRYQMTTYIPIEGRWLGDRVLGPVDRVALLTLKWWKAALKADATKQFKFNPASLIGVEHPPTTFPASKVEIKSHHLLSALNALHELDPNDALFVPHRISQPFTLDRVLDVMKKVLLYVDAAYHPATSSLRWAADGDLEYHFPKFSYQPMDTLFVEASSDWQKFRYLIESDVLQSFIHEIAEAQATVAAAGTTGTTGHSIR